VYIVPVDSAIIADLAVLEFCVNKLDTASLALSRTPSIPATLTHNSAGADNAFRNNNSVYLVPKINLFFMVKRGFLLI
jgi:hypothetical protein